MSIFSNNEIFRRMDTFRSGIGDNDAGVLFSFTNSYYMSGVPVVPWGRPTFTVVPKDDDAIIISGKLDVQNISENSPIKDVILYGDDEGPSLETAISCLSDVISRLGLKNIGFDALYTPYAYIELVKEKQPNCQFSNISELVEDMRLINSEEELELIRIANAIADHGMETFLTEAKLGMSEIELSGIVNQSMSRFSAAHYKEHEVKLNCYSQQGNTMSVHAGSSGNPLTPGQLMCVVVEATVSYYMSVVERTVGLGEILPEQQHYFDAVVESINKAIEACAPGVACSTIDKVGQDVFRKAGYNNFLCGSGLSRGLVNSYEGRLDSSNLRAYNDRPLRENMVISVEPYAVAPDVGAQRHCDTVLITGTGHEVLSKIPNGCLMIN